MNDNLIAKIADMVTEDPDVFKEAKRPNKKLDEVEHDDEFDVESKGFEHQKEPRKPGKQTHKTKMSDVGKDHPGSK